MFGRKCCNNNMYSIREGSWTTAIVASNNDEFAGSLVLNHIFMEGDHVHLMCFGCDSQISWSKQCIHVIVLSTVS